MTKINDGGAAFPTLDNAGQGVVLREWGITKRDWFAGQALEWSGNSEWFSQDPKHAAERAYAIADAMIAAREAQP